jgi:hypothetical protein
VERRRESLAVVGADPAARRPRRTMTGIRAPGGGIPVQHLCAAIVVEVRG